MKNIPILADFKNRSDLGLVYINVRSLLPKMDMIQLWVVTTDMVLSETFLKKSIPDNLIAIDGFTVCRLCC